MNEKMTCFCLGQGDLCGCSWCFVSFLTEKGEEKKVFGIVQPWLLTVFDRKIRMPNSQVRFLEDMNKWLLLLLLSSHDRKNCLNSAVLYAKHGLWFLWDGVVLALHISSSQGMASCWSWLHN